MHALSSPPSLCVTCIMGAQGSQKRVLDCMVLGTELRCPGRAVCLSLLSHLSSLSYLLFKCEVHERWEQIKISIFEDFLLLLSFLKSLQQTPMTFITRRKMESKYPIWLEVRDTTQRLNH